MRLDNGLTIKQNGFVKDIIAGESGIQAALNNYDTESINSANQIAIGNLQNPTIREQIEKALKANGLDLDSVTKNLQGLASKQVDKVSGDTVLRANVEVLKLLGAYPGSKHTQVSLSLKANLNGKSYNELKDELQALTPISGEIINDIEATD